MTLLPGAAARAHVHLCAHPVRHGRDDAVVVERVRRLRVHKEAPGFRPALVLGYDAFVVQPLLRDWQAKPEPRLHSTKTFTFIHKLSCGPDVALVHHAISYQLAASSAFTESVREKDTLARQRARERRFRVYKREAAAATPRLLLLPWVAYTFFIHS
jgi:hypothetical protein